MCELRNEEESVFSHGNDGTSVATSPILLQRTRKKISFCQQYLDENNEKGESFQNGFYPNPDTFPFVLLLDDGWNVLASMIAMMMDDC